ncbi:protein CLEC16A-like [Oncorhynchus tshawytscha]|uniref:protein CLEC16A-like n=1 Tax=Oncorhynchus tshawytscha TaxID=74940 RepID=UPI001C3DDE84|nr:protein CLEC16A-like [Oncorhynchus tshawytscha]
MPQSDILRALEQGLQVAHCVSQHSPSPLSSPSPPSSGSTGRCDSVTASTISANSPTDEETFLEHTPPSSVSGGEAGGRGGELTGSCSPVPSVLAPSLTPASQPNISLLTDDNTDSLSVESLTLLPPADHLHALGSHTHLGTDTAIREEEEEEEEEGLEKREGEEPKEEVEGSAMEEEEEETETETTIQETAEAEMGTPTEQDTPLSSEGDTPLSSEGRHPFLLRETHPFQLHQKGRRLVRTHPRERKTHLRKRTRPQKHPD